MHRFRVRYLLSALAVVAPLYLAGISVGPDTLAGDTCTDPATDNDVEYAGDVDVWCTGVPAPTAAPQPAPSPSQLPPNPSPPPSSAAPRPAPSPSQLTPSPSPLPSPVASPNASGSACPAPGAFPTAFFGPDLTGPITRTFTSQYITDSGAYVETCYPAGSSAPSSGVAGGAQAQLPMTAKGLDDATLTYNVRFPVGTQWVKGGKLPGLCGGQCWTGSNNGPGGWAARFMWRAGGAGEVLLSDATTTGYGSDLGLGSWNFAADGQWHTLTEHVHLNTAGAADGYIDVKYDQKLVAHLAGITFRAAADTNVHIDSLMFSTFYGGHDSTWAPTSPQRFDFASFTVTG